MKRLAGKSCQACGSQSIRIAAEGQILTVRCDDCTNHSILCPEPGCPGRMRDDSRKRYREQRCSCCDYTTTYHNDNNSQMRMFA